MSTFFLMYVSIFIASICVHGIFHVSVVGLNLAVFVNECNRHACTNVHRNMSMTNSETQTDKQTNTMYCLE